MLKTKGAIMGFLQSVPTILPAQTGGALCLAFQPNREYSIEAGGAGFHQSYPFPLVPPYTTLSKSSCLSPATGKFGETNAQYRAHCPIGFVPGFLCNLVCVFIINIFTPLFLQGVIGVQDFSPPFFLTIL